MSRGDVQKSMGAVTGVRAIQYGREGESHLEEFPRAPREAGDFAIRGLIGSSCSRRGTFSPSKAAFAVDVPDRTLSIAFLANRDYVPDREQCLARIGAMEIELDRRAAEASRAFAKALRERRRALRMTQVDLALATGVGRRFIIDLESGKSSAQMGRGLLVAEKLGFVLRPPLPSTNAADALALPDMEDDPDDVGPANLL